MPPNKHSDKIFKGYKAIDGVFDPEKSHPDIKFSEKNKLGSKTENDYSWTLGQGKIGFKKR
jgi:hypothetical protein